MGQKLDAVERATAAILRDLNDRSGCGIGGLDEETQEEIRDRWTAIIREAVDEELRIAAGRWGGAYDVIAERVNRVFREYRPSVENDRG